MRPIRVDFTASERLALERLAVNDLRRPSEYLRYLVNREAQARGLLPTKNDCTGLTFQGETGAIATPNL